MFIGYLSENKELYNLLKKQGYILKFKPVLLARNGQSQKGDIDADMAFNVMKYYKEYNRAILVTSDGDFDTLVSYLKKKGKLEAVLSPSKEKCSSLLKNATGNRMFFIRDIGIKVYLNK